MGAAQQGYNADANAVNASNQGISNFFGGLMNIGASAAGNPKFSDINLKENIKKVGSLDNGLNLYSYNYKEGYDLPEGKQVGVMAQEVEKIIPEAVVNMPNGFKGVNYALLGV